MGSRWERDLLSRASGHKIRGLSSPTCAGAACSRTPGFPWALVTPSTYRTAFCSQAEPADLRINLETSLQGLVVDPPQVGLGWEACMFGVGAVAGVDRSSRLQTVS